MKKLQIPTGQTTGRLVCPECSNDKDFFEIADDVIVTSHYVQNDDGSFTPEESDTEILGEIRLYCGSCNADVTHFHKYFLEMIF